MSVLTLLQRDFLSSFFAQPASASFVLVGGTALAAFHLQHRLSEDLDLFAIAPMSDTELRQSEILEMGFQAAVDSAAIVGAKLETRAPSAHFRQLFLTRGSEPRLKIDLVRDPGPTFSQPVDFDGVRVDSMLNIAVSKVVALSRMAARDYVDLFFLSKAGFRFEALLGYAKQKDPGLEEFYLGMALQAADKISAEDMPTMLKPVDLNELKSYFRSLATELVRRAKPG